MKRNLCIFILALMLCLISCVGVSAEDEYFISSEDALAVAEDFISAAAVLDDNVWNENTIISDTVILYDTDGSINAYSFELTTNSQSTGYIVISAFADIPNVILEYADESAPLYEQLNIENEENIVYLGAFDYYELLNNGQLESINNQIVDASSVENNLELSRGEIYLEKNLEILEAAQTEDIFLQAIESGSASNESELHPNIVIAHPIPYANRHYEGPFVNYEYRNVFENHVPFRTTGDYSGYNNHCGPTAITNLIEMIGSYRGIYSINKYSHNEIFRKVANYGIKKGYFSNANGSPWEYESNFVKGAFSLFGVNVTMLTTEEVTYNNVKYYINLDRPFYLTLKGHSSYGNHAVAGYAYTRFVSTTTGYYKSFIKIADGWNSTGRYIDLSHVAANNKGVIRAVKIN